MLTIHSDEPVAVGVAQAIQSGNLEALRRLLSTNPGLATARIVGPGTCEESRTLLHLATDWPGHFPNGRSVVAALIEAGAELDAPFKGSHGERPLHWAVSSGDIAVLEALLDAGADIEATGSVIGGGTPLADAVAFGQWQAARRLIERGARTTLWQAAAMGLLDRVEEAFAGGASSSPDEITNAFWCACHGGQRDTAEYLLGRGADLNWIGYDELTPLDAARRHGAEELVEWLLSRGARRSGR
jgi:ankyrin repeat protein